MNDPSVPPPPVSLAPLMRDQRKVDADHLKLIAVFHFVLAALGVVGLGFLFLHYAFVQHFLGDPGMWKNQKDAPPPEIFAFFKWFYFAFGMMIATSAAFNLVSGLAILRRKYRMLSLIVAGLNCLFFPFGTVLGVFTFVVLLRDSVAEFYEAQRTP